MLTGSLPLEEFWTNLSLKILCEIQLTLIAVGSVFSVFHFSIFHMQFFQQ